MGRHDDDILSDAEDLYDRMFKFSKPTAPPAQDGARSSNELYKVFSFLACVFCCCHVCSCRVGRGRRTKRRQRVSMSMSHLPRSSAFSVSNAGSTDTMRRNARISPGTGRRGVLECVWFDCIFSMLHVGFAQLSHKVGEHACLSGDDDRTEVSIAVVIGDVFVCHMLKVENKQSPLFVLQGSRLNINCGNVIVEVPLISGLDR